MYQKQKGATMWQWLFVGGMVGFFVFAGLKLTPIYLEGMSVKQALMKVKTSNSSLSKQDVLNKLNAQFAIDQVQRVKKENIKFKTLRNGKMEVSIEYDAKVPLFGNLNFLVEFRNKIEV